MKDMVSAEQRDHRGGFWLLEHGQMRSASMEPGFRRSAEVVPAWLSAEPVADVSAGRARQLGQGNVACHPGVHYYPPTGLGAERITRICSATAYLQRRRYIVADETYGARVPNWRVRGR